MKRVIQFLEELKDNNNREWFQANKKRYQEVKAIYESYVGEVIRGIARVDAEIEGVEVKDTVFRIYRDVRFSSDKSPYKAHMGAFIVRGGKTNPRGGYYLHVEPGNSLFAGGIWCPEGTLLKALRQDVFDNVEEFKSILQDPAFSGYYTLDGEELARVPPSFPKDSPDAWCTKYKSYTVTSKVPDSFFDQPDALQQSIARLVLLQPFNRFLNYTVDETLRGDS